MRDVNELVSRIDGVFAGVKEKVKSQQQDQLQHYLARRKRFEQYEKVLPQIVAVAKPRLEALARRAGERATVTPAVTETRRSVRFEFRTAKAHITLTFSVAPDREITDAVVECELRIVPVLWKFESQSAFRTPIADPDLDALARWLDDRIIQFVELYIQIHEDELLENAESVEDPVARVKFPKFAAGATLDHAGKTLFFIDETTKAEYARQKGLA